MDDLAEGSRQSSLIPLGEDVLAISLKTRIEVLESLVVHLLATLQQRAGKEFTSNIFVNAEQERTNEFVLLAEQMPGSDLFASSQLCFSHLVDHLNRTRRRYYP